MTQPNTALVMVDVIDAFFAPDGSLAYPGSTDVLGALGQLLATARENERLVVHGIEQHRPGAADFERHKLPAHCEIGGADANVHRGFELRDVPHEVLVPKRRYSAFFATDLDLLLREHGVQRMVVAGVKTNVCVRATIQDAFACGYDVLLPRQATNSNRPHLAEASFEDIERYFGRVVELEEGVAAL